MTQPDGQVIDHGPAVARWDHLFRPHPWPTQPDDKGKQRLSPRFVEWMQAFPEGWTDGPPKTAQLRLLGNSVVPPVAELFGRMIQGLAESAPPQGAGIATPPLPSLLPTPTSTHPGGSLEDYHGRLTDRAATFVPLNMLVEQVLPASLPAPALTQGDSR